MAQERLSFHLLCTDKIAELLALEPEVMGSSPTVNATPNRTTVLLSSEVSTCENQTSVKFAAVSSQPHVYI